MNSDDAARLGAVLDAVESVDGVYVAEILEADAGQPIFAGTGELKGMSGPFSAEIRILWGTA